MDIINAMCVGGFIVLVGCLPIKHSDVDKSTTQTINVVPYDSGEHGKYNGEMLEACQLDAASVAMDVQSYKFAVDSCVIKNKVAI